MDHWKDYLRYYTRAPPAFCKEKFTLPHRPILNALFLFLNNSLMLLGRVSMC